MAARLTILAVTLLWLQGCGSSDDNRREELIDIFDEHESEFRKVIDSIVSENEMFSVEISSFSPGSKNSAAPSKQNIEMYQSFIKEIDDRDLIVKVKGEQIWINYKAWGYADTYSVQGWVYFSKKPEISEIVAIRPEIVDSLDGARPSTTIGVVLERLDDNWYIFHAEGG